MAKANETVNEKVTVASLLDSTLLYGNMTILAGEIVIIDKKDAEILIDKGFVKEIKVKSV